MNIKGVITGDIVNSTKINIEYRDQLLNSILKITEELKELSPLKIELFRGDSFQLVIDRPEQALKIAVLLRAGLKQCSPCENYNIWDARVSVGIGEISYTSERVVVSDGEAFHLSGRGLDEIGKQRLSIRTPWEDLTEELKLNTAFADDIITDWSFAQAQVVYQMLLYQTPQKEIAVKFNKTAQSISKLLSAAKENLIDLFLQRYSILVTEKLTQWI